MTDSERSSLVVMDLALSEYPLVHELQRELVEKKRKNRQVPDHLILVEHPSVYTFGRRAKTQPLFSDVPCYGVERGGEATFHNPGQLVAYPVLALSPHERDAHQYLRRLEEVILDTLAAYGIQGQRRAGATGVWIAGGRRKIASIGIAMSAWLTYHGCAVNVENDLSGFFRIQPCGFDASVMTSMKNELGNRCPSMADVKRVFVDSFCRHFCRHEARPASERNWGSEKTSAVLS